MEGGDVIYIKANSGAMKNQDRCGSCVTELDFEVKEYVSLPMGAVHKKKEIIQEVTLHSLQVVKFNQNPNKRNRV